MDTLTGMENKAKIPGVGRRGPTSARQGGTGRFGRSFDQVVENNPKPPKTGTEDSPPPQESEPKQE